MSSDHLDLTSSPNADAMVYFPFPANLADPRRTIGPAIFEGELVKAVVLNMVPLGCARKGNVFYGLGSHAADGDTSISHARPPFLGN